VEVQAFAVFRDGADGVAEGFSVVRFSGGHGLGGKVGREKWRIFLGKILNLKKG
jgi:hypothetical protein